MMAYGPKKGQFRPVNPHKYKGRPDQIFYRSSWELRVMQFLDMNSVVESWSSEETPIPYMDRTSGRKRRYFPDFVATFRTPNGPRTVMMEVKPHSQTQQPVRKSSKPSRRYITEVMTYGKNQCKWDAAREYCSRRGWDFAIMTEYDLGLKDK